MFCILFTFVLNCVISDIYQLHSSSYYCAQFTNLKSLLYVSIHHVYIVTNIMSLSHATSGSTTQLRTTMLNKIKIYVSKKRRFDH